MMLVFGLKVKFIKILLTVKQLLFSFSFLKDFATDNVMLL